ncbi:RagB/SusD family nutrient uptake outer membrane protein, partial [bacterium]|nr:RagB/SusD family nutrient uptake outer membrane protein [bacterium]
MKNKNIKSLAVVFVALMFTSCVKDLDVTPRDPNIITSLTVYSTPAAYKEGLAKLYATFAVSGQQGPSGQPDIAGIDEGFGNYLRQYWNAQELPTDEAVMAWNDASIKDFHWQTWAPNDVFISAIYSRIMYTVALSNEYIRATAGNTDADIKKYHAEARFIRALAYSHAIDLFGNPPFVTEADAPGAFFPKQTTRAELFTYIESELKAIENDLGASRFEYARADQGAAWTLLAKLYLNAKVYIGQDKNTECITYCNKVIAAGYTLSSKYANNFTADNNLSTEMIFPITSDGQHTQTYGGMTYLIHAQIGGSMPPAQFGVGGGWGGIRTTKALVNKFADNTGATDKRAMFWSAGQKFEISDIGQFTDGWAITKFSNLTSTGAAAPHAHP